MSKLDFQTDAEKAVEEIERIETLLDTAKNKIIDATKAFVEAREALNGFDCSVNVYIRPKE